MRTLLRVIGCVCASWLGVPAQASTFVASGTAFDFGNVALGTTVTHEVTFTNVSSSAQVFSGTGGGFNPGDFGGAADCGGRTIAAGASCTYYYSFSPTTLGAATATTGGTANGDYFAFSFKGTGIESMNVTPTSINLGDVPTGTNSRIQTVTITNVSKASQTLNLAGGGSYVFEGASDCGSKTLAPGGACTIQYSIKPTAAGTYADTTAISVNGQYVPISLTATSGMPDGTVFAPNGTAFDFGNVPLGETKTEQIQFTNVTSTPQVFSGAGGGFNPGDFEGAADCESRTIAPGASCTYYYSFTPSALGEETGSTGGSANGGQFSLSFKGDGILPFLVDTTAFDFGDVKVGSNSLTEIARIYNVSDIAQAFNFSGGGFNDTRFGAAGDCTGTMLAPGAYCSIYYSFSPTENGVASTTTEIGVDGYYTEISVTGNGFGGPDNGGGTGGDTGGGDTGGGSGSTVPEPANWMAMLLGFGLIGGVMRRRTGSRRGPVLSRGSC